MPEYVYRRDDGTTFSIKQKFSDDPLTVDPETGQNVVRIIQPAGVIFKGSGFYVNDSRNASKRNLGPASGEKSSETKAEKSSSDTTTKSSNNKSDAAD